MALELYSPLPESTVGNPVTVTWQYQSGTGTDYVFYNDGLSWVRLSDDDYQCDADQCTSDIDLGEYGTKTISVWMNYDQTPSVNFTTSETITGPSDITVVVDTSKLEAAVAELKVLTEENQMYSDVLLGVVLAAAFMFAAINGFSTGSGR